MTPLFPGHYELLADAQLRPHATHHDGVLAEAHSAQLAIEAIGLQCRQRLDAIERAALLIRGRDGATRAGLDDAQRHLLGSQLVDAILVIGADTVDDYVRPEPRHR